MERPSPIIANLAHSPMPDEAGICDYISRCDHLYPPDAIAAPIVQQRKWYEDLCAAFATSPPDTMVIRDVQAGHIRMRHYSPAGLRNDCHLLYVGGGGYVLGSIESQNAICADLAAQCNIELTAFEYRHAPEHIWPAAHEDGWQALQFLAMSGKQIIVIGEGSGAGLAAGLILRARENHLDGMIAGQVLIYPALGGDLGWPSYGQMAHAPGMGKDDVIYYRNILRAPMDNPYAYPMAAADLRGLPPCHITAAYFDPLRDDGREYAARLARAGVMVSYCEEAQLIHGWMHARHISPQAGAGFARLCRAICALAHEGGG